MKLFFVALITACLLPGCKQKQSAGHNTADTVKQVTVLPKAEKEVTKSAAQIEAEKYEDSIKKAVQEYAKKYGIPNESDVIIDGPTSIHYDIYSKRDISLPSPFKKLILP